MKVQQSKDLFSEQTKLELNRRFQIELDDDTFVAIQQLGVPKLIDATKHYKSTKAMLLAGEVITTLTIFLEHKRMIQSRTPASHPPAFPITMWDPVKVSIHQLTDYIGTEDDKKSQRRNELIKFCVTQICTLAAAFGAVTYASYLASSELNEIKQQVLKIESRLNK